MRIVSGSLCLTALVCMVLIVQAIASTPDARQAHNRADAILKHTFVAAWNEWDSGHGHPEDPGHFDKIDAKDEKRFHAACEAFDAWKDAMKQAGY